MQTLGAEIKFNGGEKIENDLSISHQYNKTKELIHTTIFEKV